MFSMILEEDYEELDEVQLVTVNGGGCVSITTTQNAPNQNPAPTENPQKRNDAPQNPPSGGGNGGSGGGSTTVTSGGCTVILPPSDKNDANVNPENNKEASSNDKENLNKPSDSKDSNNKEKKLAKTYYDGRWAWCLGEDFSPDNYPTDYWGETEDRQELSETESVSTFHHGLDLKAKIGERINSIMDGKITEIGNSEELGNYVVIQLEGGPESIKFCHCGTIDVTLGQSVVAGEKVATVGMTGTTTGSHLHIAYDGNGDGIFYSEDLADNPYDIIFPQD